MSYSVLLLEDDDPLRHSLSEVLRSWGYGVVEARAGDEAIEAAKAQRLDLSLLDLHVPGVPGSEVLRVIRHEIARIPAIVMSGEATAEEASTVRALGAFAFLRKPLRLTDLRTCIDDLVAEHLGATRNPHDPYGRHPSG